MHTTPRDIADKQLAAYNAHDLDAFCALFAEDAVLIDLVSDTVTLTGLDNIRAMYADRFAHPALKCIVHSRMELGPFAIDRETVVGLPSGDMEVIAIYEVKEGLIRSIRFIRAP